MESSLTLWGEISYASTAYKIALQCTVARGELKLMQHKQEDGGKMAVEIVTIKGPNYQQVWEAVDISAKYFQWCKPHASYDGSQQFGIGQEKEVAKTETALLLISLVSW